jgi:hypothetical protein
MKSDPACAAEVLFGLAGRVLADRQYVGRDGVAHISAERRHRLRQLRRFIWQSKSAQVLRLRAHRARFQQRKFFARAIAVHQRTGLGVGFYDHSLLPALVPGVQSVGHNAWQQITVTNENKGRILRIAHPDPWAIGIDRVPRHPAFSTPSGGHIYCKGAFLRLAPLQVAEVRQIGRWILRG